MNAVPPKKGVDPAARLQEVLTTLRQLTSLKQEGGAS